MVWMPRTVYSRLLHLLSPSQGYWVMAKKRASYPQRLRTRNHHEEADHDTCLYHGILQGAFSVPSLSYMV